MLGTETRPRAEMHARDDRSLGELIRELRDETTLLFRDELQLAKAELHDKAARAGRNVVYLFGGALIAFAGAIVLLMGVSALCSIGLSMAGVDPAAAAWLGPVVVGALVCLIGAGMVAKAKTTLKNDTVLPERTTRSMKENKAWIAGKMS